MFAGASRPRAPRAPEAEFSPPRQPALRLRSEPTRQRGPTFHLRARRQGQPRRRVEPLAAFSSLNQRQREGVEPR